MWHVAYLTIIRGMWQRMYVPQSLENPCTDLDQNHTTYSPWPPMVMGGGLGQGHARSKVTWGKILKFTGEFNRGHQRSFQGHHHISETPAPILTKLAQGVALDPPPPDGYRGSGSRSPKGEGHVGGQILKFEGGFNRGHMRIMTSGTRA